MRLTVLVDAWPVLSETFIRSEVAALARAGHRVRVEAGTRAAPGQAAAATAQPAAVTIGQDDTRRRRLVDLARLAVRHPVRCLADLRERDAWRPADQPRTLRELAPAARRVQSHATQHLHAHFAAGAALDALRLGALLGLPVSITAHANDIFATPRNLEAKLARASFTTSGCGYTVEALRAIVGPPHAQRVHEVIMGVDPQRFVRRLPHPHSGPVVAVGRLVAKKGFADLVAAVGLLRDRGRPPVRTVIVGDGPLHEALHAQIARLDLHDLVELTGPLPHEAVRDLLERAAVLAMPCVVAPDGDRDSMPVVVKEALAMEVPVVASEEVGLPELVRPPWGRLHAPGEPAALAAALQELVSLDADARATMGRAGRAFVSERCHVDREAQRLAGLIAGTGERAGTGGPRATLIARILTRMARPQASESPPSMPGRAGAPTAPTARAAPRSAEASRAPAR